MPHQDSPGRTHSPLSLLLVPAALGKRFYGKTIQAVTQQQEPWKWSTTLSWKFLKSPFESLESTQFTIHISITTEQFRIFSPFQKEIPLFPVPLFARAPTTLSLFSIPIDWPILDTSQKQIPQ